MANGFYLAFTIKWTDKNIYLGNDGKFQVQFIGDLAISLMVTDSNINGVLYAIGV